MILALLLIIGGSQPSQAHGAVGAFGPGDVSSWHCSATLVAPNVILTARHCLDYGPGGPYSVRFVDGQVVPVVSYHIPISGDAALGYLEKEVEWIEPIPAIFGYADTGTQIELVGWGSDAGELSACQTETTWVAPESYIQFDPAGEGQCGVGAHDSGGAVLVREGLEYRVVGDITGTTDANNLTRFQDDPAFVDISAPFCGRQACR